MSWHYTLPKKSKEKVGDPEIWIFTKKEIIWMIIVIIMMSFILGFTTDSKSQSASIRFTNPLIASTLIIFVSAIAKKIGASRNYIKIEQKIWEFQRWSYYKRSKFKKPIPLGLIFSFFLAFFTLGHIKPLVFMQFNGEDIPSKRVLKHRGLRRNRRREVLAEADLGYTAAWGFYSILMLALIGVIIKFFFNLDFGTDLTNFSIYYGLWNLVPFGQLDGTKLFFGVFLGWIFITIIYLVSLVAIILV